jgi:methylmalonyl-CoA mutase
MSLQAQWVNQLKKELKTDSLSEFQSEIEGLSWDFSDNNKHLPNFDFSSKYNTPCVFFSYYNVVNEKHSNTEILKDLNQGIQGILICWDNTPNFDVLFNGILFEYIQTRVIISTHEDLHQINQWIAKVKPANFTIEFSEHTSDTIQFIDGFSMYAIGANAWQELAFVCNKLVTCIPNTPHNHGLTIELGIGENFIVEVAKITAIQWLCEAILTKHQRTDIHINLRVKIGWRNKSKREIHTNQIRQTSEALCALVAGVNQLCITPYDQMFNEGATELSRRMAINIGHILKEESHLDWFNGLSKGSFITTHLVHQLCNLVWSQLALTEGFDEELKSQTKATIALRNQRITDQIDQFIGINYLVNPSEPCELKRQEFGAFGLPYLFFETN